MGLLGSGRAWGSKEGARHLLAFQVPQAKRRCLGGGDEDLRAKRVRYSDAPREQVRASRGAKPRRRGLGDGPEPEPDTHLPLTSPLPPRQTETPITSPKLTSPYITSPSPHPTYLPHPSPRRLTFPVSLPHLPHHPNDYLTSPLTSSPRMTSYPPHIPTSPSLDLLPPSPTPSFRKEHSDLLSSTRPHRAGYVSDSDPVSPSSYPSPTSHLPQILTSP